MTLDQISSARLFHLGGSSGAPVLLIHGFGSSRLSWVGTALGLAGYRVYAVDLPAHGDAGNDVGEGTHEAMACAVIAAIRELPRPFAVVGHSLGATVSLHLAEMLPQDISHVAVIAPGGWGRLIDHSFLKAFPELRQPEEAESLLHRLVSRKSLIRPQMVSHVLHMLEQPGRRDALRRLAAGILASPPPPLPKVENLCVIWGAEDRISPPDLGRLAAFGDQAAVLEGVGHLPHVEAQTAVNRLLKGFLPH